MKQYNHANIPLAKELRKNMTPWERKLWYEYLRYYPVRFQRQKAIDNYIVDFYCAKAGIAVELDGGGHYELAQQAADALRTKALNEIGLRVLRFSNLNVDRNFRGVCEKIDMEVLNSLPQSASLTAPSSEGAVERRKNNKAIFALGFFDGVHRGHQTLLSACRSMAQEAGVSTAAITFEKHPQALFTKELPPLLNTAADRRDLLRQYGIERILTYPVTEAVMGIPWRDFLLELCRNQGAVGFVCGHDFRFGHKGEGNCEKLREFCAEFGLSCTVVPEQNLDGVRISSTHIRSLLENGDMEQAVKFLGHPHILTGEVVSGRQLGRTIGIPTANLHLPEDVLVPKFGVYCCKAVVDGKDYLAVTNVGNRPTVGGHRVTVEPWLLDFEGDLYGKKMTLQFHAFLRPERKFASLEELRWEIRKNAEQTREFFEK